MDSSFSFRRDRTQPTAWSSSRQAAQGTASVPPDERVEEGRLAIGPLNLLCHTLRHHLPHAPEPDPEGMAGVVGPLGGNGRLDSSAMHSTGIPKGISVVGGAENPNR